MSRIEKMRENNEIKKIKETLENHEKRIKFLENTLAVPKGEEVTPTEAKASIEKLAQKIGVAIDKVEELYDIEDNKLTLLKITNGDEREKTQKISLTVLLGYKYIFGNEEIQAMEIRRNVAENRVPLNNFATYLNEIIPSLIRRKGKPKSPKTTYKLTPLGEAEAKELLKKLCE
jgi:hypothetical protein